MSGFLVRAVKVGFVRGWFVLLLLCVLGGCAKRPSDPTEAAKHFFDLLAADDVSAAYAETAFGFQAQQTQIAFTHNVKELGLARPMTAVWEAPEVTDDEAKVRVEITTEAQEKVTMLVTLVRQEGAWRVHALRMPRGPGQRSENRFSLVGKGASFSDAQNQPLPADEDVQKLARTTMAKFDEAVQQKSFAEFYQTVAAAWRKQLSVSQLERAFAPFINAEVKIGGLSQAEMSLDGPPNIGPEGILVVNGHFNTAPYQIYFSMKFVFEQPFWKLFGLDVHLQH